MHTPVSSSALPWSMRTGFTGAAAAAALPATLLPAPRFAPPFVDAPRLALPSGGGVRPAPPLPLPGSAWQDMQDKSLFDKLKVALTSPPWIYVAMAFLMFMHTLSSSFSEVPGAPFRCGNAPCGLK